MFIKSSFSQGRQEDYLWASLALFWPWGVCRKSGTHFNLTKTLIDNYPCSSSFWKVLGPKLKETVSQRDMSLELPVTSWRIPKSEASPVYSVM